VHRVHDGPFAPLSWEEAADALEAALKPVLTVARERKVPFAIEHTNSLRVDVGFVHTLRDAVDLAAGSTAACVWSSTPAGPSEGSRRRSAKGADRLRLVQVKRLQGGHHRVVHNGWYPADGDVPIARILADVIARDTWACSTSS